jgi:O-antigen/teichoic acid export membrane protein
LAGVSRYWYFSVNDYPFCFLGPIEFGVFSLVFAIFSLFIKFGDAGFLYAIQKFVPVARVESEQKAIKTLDQITSLRWKVLLLWIPAILLSPVISWAFQLPHWWIYPLAVTFSLIAIWFEHCMTVYQALHKFIPAMVMFVSLTLKLLVVGCYCSWGLNLRVLLLSLHATFGVVPVCFIKKYLRSSFSPDKKFTPRLNMF